MTDLFLIALGFIRLLGLTFLCGVISTMFNGGTIPEFERVFVIVLALEVARLGIKARRHD